MSSPASGFSRLSLSRMASTRPEDGATQPSNDSSDASDSEDSNDDSGEDSSPEDASILRSAHTKLRYDTSRLTRSTTRRARAGLNEPFTLSHCSVYNPSEGSEYFAFQIFETVSFSVRVGAPDSEYRSPTCHCDSDPGPCRHIFWLLDQIASHTLSSSDKSTPLPLSSRGFSRTPANADAYHHITASGPHLFQELDCDHRIAPSYTKPSPAAATAARITDIRDILASFSPATRDDYRPDIFSAPPPTPSSPLLFPTDLEKTLAHAALANPDLFRHLRALVPSSHCTASFFRKQRARAAAALAKLDAYTATRPRAAAAGGPLVVVHDVKFAATAVSEAVAAILARVHEARAPLSIAARQAAAESLALTLLDLSKRNIDVYATPIWKGTRQQTLSLTDRNIFAHFFGSEPPAGGERFLVDGLANLGDAGRGVVGVLEEAREAFGARAAPVVYGEKLGWLVGSLRREGAGAREGKRGAGEGEGRGRKRMK
ncbi:hypothetical protein GMDG_04138 [Pseudogymnoascus destructans 20631-21]|uniref:SWIM-type domain-containing protein n=1 Tax=Pseudogymnoascus destructans (strain ATCC MYA-4855 / 20631-21) TaxID=658429 RepID=L8G9B2_PSED2|nr:hypothetical protein GMDG_04138 [Pseudogymnoascus destructans 20631-21]